MKPHLDFATRLADAQLEWKNGDSFLHRVSIKHLAAVQGTPFYVYDAERLVQEYRRLREALPDAIDIYYSIKANPHPRLISILLREGAGCEIASGGEYAIARRAGAVPDRIALAGPAKGRDELEYVIGNGIGEIHLESFEEINILECLAKSRGCSVRVTIRVNPSFAGGGRLLMGGEPTAFGFEEESLDKVAKVISTCAHLDLRGVHLYTGTQILEASVLLQHWEHAFVVGQKLSQLTGTPIESINFGGGLGIPYFAKDSELDLTSLATGARLLIESAKADPRLARCRFVVEPGRFLVASAGIYVSCVRSVKECRGTTFVVLDGGMNHHLAASGNVGQVIRRDFPIVNLSRNDPSDQKTVAVVGPLCTPIDTLGRKVTLTTPRPGDLLGILHSGAYGLTASPTRFLSHPAPAEILVGISGYEVITARGVTFG